PTMGDTAIYLFTSGTTGLPKAAPGSHRKFMKAYGGFGMMSLDMKPDDVLYCTLPLYHGTALLVCWGSVMAGGSAIALRRKFSASAFWDDVRYFQATTFGYVGELCRYLLNQPPSEQDRNHNLTKMIGNGLRPSIWKEFKGRFGIETVAELYASSEGNIGFSNFFNLDNTVGFSTAPYKLVKFHDGTRDPVRNDSGFMQEVEKGEPGLLIGEITKKWSFEGYTQKDATEKSILRDAFKKGDQWFNTGDVLKEIGCGHLQFVDRMGDTFRWKGENVSTTEVENIIDGSNMVEEAIVYGVEIPGTNGKAGMVTLVPHANGQAFDVNRLFRYLSDNLPPYAIPVFVRVTGAIEKTGTFKYRKVDIQKAGYSIDKPGEEVYAWLPGTDGYTRLTPELVAQIDSGAVRF
ncbi:long-chain-acyl-CoA synthetase, partial [Marinobacter sp.]